MELPDPEELRKLVEGINQMARPDQDALQIDLEANDLRARNFIEGLTDTQVEDLLWLVSGMAVEGQGNYTTFTLRGILMSEIWHRRPIGSVGLDDGRA